MFMLHVRALVFMLRTCASVHVASVCLCSCCVRMYDCVMLYTCACVHVAGFNFNKVGSGTCQL